MRVYAVCKTESSLLSGKKGFPGFSDDTALKYRDVSLFVCWIWQSFAIAFRLRVFSFFAQGARPRHHRHHHPQLRYADPG